MLPYVEKIQQSKIDYLLDAIPIQYFNTNVYERRSNFNNQSIFTKEVLEGEECMKDVFALFQRKFNFAPKYETGFTAYGSRAPNGTWKGSIGRDLVREWRRNKMVHHRDAEGHDVQC